MKIEKVKVEPRPKPHTKTLRFKPDNQREADLRKRLEAAAARAGMKDEPFIKALLEQALNDPKFVLRVPSKP